MHKQIIETKGNLITHCQKIEPSQILKSKFNHHFSRGEYHIAIEILIKMKDETRINKQKIKNKLLKCYYLLGKSFWNKGELNVSLIYWHQINEMSPNKSAASHYYEGICRWVNDDLEKATICFKNAVRLQPNIVKYRQVLDSFSL